ncbi:50S ribosomal protein L19 [Candidatus Woesebacteria bacterium]|nr:50S ribosomal protein L19 [Candidatus Woesebacteria bacterium]
MAIITKHKDVKFGVGDNVKVSYLVKEGEKERTQVFNGIVIAIKGREEGKTFTVRRIGAQKIGIERIFPIQSPNLVKIEVVREGVRGVKRAKLYYLRDKSKKETEKIYKKAKNKNKKVEALESSKKVNSNKKTKTSKKKSSKK